MSMKFEGTFSLKLEKLQFASSISTALLSFDFFFFLMRNTNEENKNPTVLMGLTQSLKNSKHVTD